MQEIFDYYFYCQNFMKIKTKMDGLTPFHLRKYQKRFIEFVDNIDGPCRVVVLKPRQAGFSTLISSYLAHKMFTNKSFHGIAMCDKKERTQSLAKMFTTFHENLPEQLRPMIALSNTEQLLLDNPSRDIKTEFKGLDSGVLYETANDPNAGRSGTRRFAHLSEVAFYRYAKEIDDGVQNSIPLTSDTYIFKESTANGKAGIGKYFYDLWNQAKRGDSLYKPFFVAWYEVDDYQIQPNNFKATKQELDILKRCPDVTEANLMWRRLKLMEYLDDSEDQTMTPEDRFKQDFPLDDVEAFLSTGQAIFDQYELDNQIKVLNNCPIRNIKDSLEIKGTILRQHYEQLKIFSPPRAHKKYFIGADIAEGLASGDNSSVCIIDESFNQVATWHGKIDPDLFAYLLMDLAVYYNTALLNPEINNMGHTTLTTLRNEGYTKIYRRKVVDKITKEIKTQIGWRTTKSSKSEMINSCVTHFRDRDLKLKDKSTLIEMSEIARGENGIVELNGKDRTVALCLSVMARNDYYIPVEVKTKPNMLIDAKAHIDKYMNKKKKPSEDIF